ncbi:unnamed protein product [Triticum turgidum subsp. durum]|uniref:Uncharacterized protein n=1 Tax=Triticum turgidum subsp. durum TaxID=4567 RepID=A0A9R0VBQ0_TRITD|nr:unnamed protein product [Triticum turgidum subsp. durum]
MPKRTMGGRADTGAGALVAPPPELVAPPPEQVTPLPRHLPPLPRHLPPLPQPVVNIDGDDDEEEVAALAPQTEQVSPLPRVTPPVPKPMVVSDVNKEDIKSGVYLPRLLPPLPPPVVVADDNKEEVFPGQYKANKVLSDDVDSDPETQRIFRRQKLRQLDNGELEKAVRPRFGKGYRCPYCNKVMKGDLSSTINHAVGTSQGSTKNGYAFRVKHTTYADYLMRLL